MDPTEKMQDDSPTFSALDLFSDDEESKENNDNFKQPIQEVIRRPTPISQSNNNSKYHHGTGEVYANHDHHLQRISEFLEDSIFTQKSTVMSTQASESENVIQSKTGIDGANKGYNKDVNMNMTSQVCRNIDENTFLICFPRTKTIRSWIRITTLFCVLKQLLTATSCPIPSVKKITAIFPKLFSNHMH